MRSVNRDGFIVHLAIIWKIKNGRGISPQPLRIYRQHRTKPACRLCAASADEFSVISHRNSLQYASIPASFLCNLTKNLLAHLGVCTDTIRNWLKASGIQPKETERQSAWSAASGIWRRKTEHCASNWCRRTRSSRS